MDIDRKNIGQLNSKSDYKRRLLIVILFGLGVLLFTLMTAFSDRASFFAFSGLALMAVSGVLAVFNSVHEGKKGSAVARRRRHFRPWARAGFEGKPSSSDLTKPHEVCPRLNGWK